MHWQCTHFNVGKYRHCNEMQCSVLLFIKFSSSIWTELLSKIEISLIILNMNCTTIRIAIVLILASLTVFCLCYFQTSRMYKSSTYKGILEVTNPNRKTSVARKVQRVLLLTSFDMKMSVKQKNNLASSKFTSWHDLCRRTNCSTGASIYAGLHK